MIAEEPPVSPVRTVSFFKKLKEFILKPIFYALASITACLLVCLGLLAIGESVHATGMSLDTNLNVALDPSLDVCRPADAVPQAKIPELSAPATTPQAVLIKERSTAADSLANTINQLAMADAPGFHFERRCPTGDCRNGCQLVKVMNAPQAQAPGACQPASPSACGPCQQAESEEGGRRHPILKALGALRPRKIASRMAGRMQARRGE